ncbi:tetratricopeptide repeat protein [Candidatus Odyssella thessalonicensis]|uniref:tetratricopeptide repeat protein n=1 Tax=Candidatus Odyssella thessalonicensis TaxID=84647 RepID=UPI000225B21E|nr:SEL1-like repeat protein [Candidatus Odyssella thessalonicensis]
MRVALAGSTLTYYGTAMDCQGPNEIESGSRKRKAAELESPAETAKIVEEDSIKRARSTEISSFETLLLQADANNPQAQYELGIAYQQGRITPKDLGKAFAWLQRTAEQGYAAAQFKLANCYFTVSWNQSISGISVCYRCTLD